MIEMVNIVEKKLDIEEGAKKKFDLIGNFVGCKPKIINGSIRSIERTNISYIEPHRIIFKDITFLFFNYTNEVYVETLEHKIRINEIESYLKA
jgi:hypothetical protein